MGVVLGSGYSQVPLAPESALAILAMIASEEIRAQCGDREDPILEEVKYMEMLVESEGSHGVRSKC